MPAKIIATDITKIFPSVNGPVTAIDAFNLEADEGEFVCIVGPSGCGKSTFLRILADLVPLTAGQVTIVPGSDPGKPLNNVVFQEYAIFPWKTVLDNVAFGLQMRGFGRRKREAVANEWLGRVGLRKFASYYPAQLSGGMKQRVAIARALSVNPAVLLMDEPLSALDSQTSELLLADLMALWERERYTACYITHNLAEAVRLGHRVVVLSRRPGRIREIVDIDLPLSERGVDNPALGAIQRRLWEMMREEAADADRALADA